MLALIMLATVIQADTVQKPAPQNPSPMVEHTRAHVRPVETHPDGTETKLSLGTLFVSKACRAGEAVPLVIHLLGPAWLPESAAVQWHNKVAVINISVGAGSAVFARAFADPNRLSALLSEASQVAGRTFKPVTITSFSAGYGSVRNILRNTDNWRLIDAIVLEDSLHTSYVPDGTPGPLDAPLLQPFLDFAKAAVQCQKRMLIIHSEIFPGTFASTTETADYLLQQLGLKRTPVLKWGPGGMQQLSDVQAGCFHLMGFAGNSGPDHIDILDGEGTWLKTIWR